METSRWYSGGAVVLDASKGEDRFSAGPRALLRWFQSGRNRIGRMKKVWLFSNRHGGALLSWFQSRRKGLGTCNRFEELNK